MYMRFMYSFPLLVLSILLLSCSNRKQLQYKTIKARLQPKGDSLIHIKYNNYIIALRQDDLMAKYNTDYQSQIKKILITRDSMNFYKTSVVVDSVVDLNNSFKSLNLQVKSLIDDKQFTVYDPETKKYISKLIQEKDSRLSGTVGIIWQYKNPKNDELIFQYTDVFIGTPAF